MLPDVLEEVIPVLQGAADDKADFVVVTGGLGPTPDDLTVEAVARWLGEGTYQEPSLLEDYMRRRQISEDELSPGTAQDGNSAGKCNSLGESGGLGAVHPSKQGRIDLLYIAGPPARDGGALRSLCCYRDFGNA